MRRFDKNKNIERANLLVEQRHLENNSLSESDETITEINSLFESDTQQLNEVGVTTILALILSAGKFLDLIGVIGKKIYNLFSKKKIDQTKFEKWGQKYSSLIVKSIAYFIKSNTQIPDEQAQKIANIVFIVLITGLWGGTVAGGIPYDGAMYIAKMATQMVKTYEIGVTVGAIILYIGYDEIKKAGNITDVPHAIEACMENGSVRDGLKNIGDKVGVSCVVKQMSHH